MASAQTLEEKNPEGEATDEEKEDKTSGRAEKDIEKESKENISASSKKDVVAISKEDAAVTPRPTRERKVVERYSAPEAGRSATKPLSIEKGSGTQLKDIPNVSFKLSKRKPDDNLQTLHTILFGKKGKAHNMKKNIGQFSGYVWVENEEKQKAKVREKLDKCVKEKLLDFCDVLNIPVNKAIVRKEELTVKILDFLESPHPTTDVLLADKEQKAKKRKLSTPKNVSREDATVTPAKKQKQTSQSEEKRKRASKEEEDEDEEDKVESPDVKEESEEDGENDTAPKEESDHEGGKSDEEEKEKEEHEQKNQGSTKKSSSKKTVRESSGAKSKDKPSSRKSTPAKSEKTPSKSAKKSSTSSSKLVADTDGTSGSKLKSKASSKKQKVDKENTKDHDNSAKEKVTSKKQSGMSSAKTSAKDQGKSKSSKKTKAEPTREELHAVVGEILKKVDFNTATLSDILKSLGDHFGIDLLHRKAEVKDIITEVINDMSDESEGEEADENAEAGDDGDKDEGEDDDCSV